MERTILCLWMGRWKGRSAIVHCLRIVGMASEALTAMKAETSFLAWVFTLRRTPPEYLPI
jgi:hypothetical protein